MRRRWLAPLVLLLLLLPAVHVSAQAQEDGRYYPETGHTLDDRFIIFFDAHGGVAMLGYPITESFVMPASGKVIQYLENSRLELASGDVVQTRLGTLLAGDQSPTATVEPGEAETPGCRLVEPSPYHVCHAFLDFYESHGGAGMLGLPVSEFRMEGERIVQYFELFRLDWYPEGEAGGEMRVAPLGRIHFDTIGYDPELLRPNLPEDMSLYRVVDLHPQASVSASFTRPTDTVRVFVVVRDQNNAPVAGASVSLTARFPAGDRVLILPVTNAQGVTSLDLSFDDQPPGSNIALEIWAVQGALRASTRDSFRIWW
jgi:hypothetical protein